jgi:hypothetical protein
MSRSKVENERSETENINYFINTFLEYCIFRICCQNFKGFPDN